jgi:bifunctional non-homologous end joining protein LigD
VRLSHPEKEFWPGITKRDLAEYWAAVADRALPEIAGRPLAIVRCPDGIGHEHFFQKHASLGFPKQLRAAEAGGAPYIVLEDAAGLIAAAQMGALELHAWGARESDPLHPDRIVFDLDPGEGITMADLAAAAHEVRDRLQRLSLDSFCRTSGGKGLHVVAPLTPRADWDSARAWCRAFAELMVADSPDRYVAAIKKSIRAQKILVDWLRNGLGSTAIASFSPRARPGAGVATRLAWTEVTGALDPAAFNLRTVPDRITAQKADPWAGFEAASRPLPLAGKS